MKDCYNEGVFSPPFHRLWIVQSIIIEYGQMHIIVIYGKGLLIVLLSATLDGFSLVNRRFYRYMVDSRHYVRIE